MSRMITTCPNCALRLAVSANDLRAGQGHVRCGRCTRAFNALLSLTDSPDAPPKTASQHGGETSITLQSPVLNIPSSRQQAWQDNKLRLDLTTRALEQTTKLEATAARIPETPLSAFAATPGRAAPRGNAAPNLTVVSALAAPSSTDPDLNFENLPFEDSLSAEIDFVVAPPKEDSTSEIAIEDLAFDGQGVMEVEETDTGIHESIILEGEGSRPEEEIYFDARETLAAESLSTRQADSLESSSFETAAAKSATVDPIEEFAIESAPAVGFGKTHWGWSLAASVLALGLLSQMVHHFRHSLADGPAAGPLRMIYGSLGLPLDPAWDLGAYEVRQLGGEPLSGTPEKIQVRASVQNRAGHAQPPPVLRVTLQDRFGADLATHDIAPAAYLLGVAPERLAPEQRLDAQIVLPDPGKKAVGFELDACLPDSGTQLRCAAGP